MFNKNFNSSQSKDVFFPVHTGRSLKGVDSCGNLIKVESCVHCVYIAHICEVCTKLLKNAQCTICVHIVEVPISEYVGMYTHDIYLVRTRGPLKLNALGH